MNDDPLAAFPAELIASSGRKDVRYHRQPRQFAVHGPVPPAWQARVEQVLGDGDVSLCRGDVPTAFDPDIRPRLSPVYALSPGSPPAVPTGRVFVRFTEEVAAQDRRDDLARLGYRILRVTPYAPHTAWLNSLSGAMSEALAGLPELAQVRDMVNVEPEMLKPMVRRE